MTVYVFAGPNGSGKSSVIPEFIKEHHIEDVEYICPDIYASTYFSEIPDIMERYGKAMDYAEYKRKRLLSEKKSMIIETVLSREDKLDFLREAAAMGYSIVAVFVGTDSPEINIARVAKRVSEGGHDVPADKIRARYYRSMQNLKALSDVSDELYVYDNSTSLHLVSASIHHAKYCSDDAPDWAKNI